MSWYWILLIVLGIAFLILFLFREGDRKVKKRRLAEISKWMVGDELITDKHYAIKARENGKKYPKLVKWDENEVLIDCGASFYAVKYHYIEENLTFSWRERYLRMDNFMKTIGAKQLYKENDKSKKEGEYESKMDIIIEGNQVTIDGTPLIGMPEIYLTIYQGLAIKEKKFKLLELINEELKKHR